MRLKLVNRDPFSSGTEYDYWSSRNCDKCWKSSHIKSGSDPDDPDYTSPKCSIQRDIITMMWSNEPIAQRTIDICRKADCPYRQEERPRKRHDRFKNEPKLFDV